MTLFLITHAVLCSFLSPFTEDAGSLVLVLCAPSVLSFLTSGGVCLKSLNDVGSAYAQHLRLLDKVFDFADVH
jgi:hypothetical protein